MGTVESVSVCEISLSAIFVPQIADSASQMRIVSFLNLFDLIFVGRVGSLRAKPPD